MLGYSVTGCSSRSAQVTRVAQRVTMSCPTARPSIIRQLPLYIVNLSEHLHVKNKVLDTVGGVQKKEFILCKRELEEGLLVRRGRRLGNVQQFCAAHLCSAIVNQAHYEPSLTSEQWVHFTRLTQCSVRKGQNKSRSP